MAKKGICQMKFFYCPQQVATSQSYSPSALKPRLVVADWKIDYKINMEICSFEPVDAQTIALAHDPEFVRSVLACEIDNGFETRDADVAASLPYASALTEVEQTMTNQADRTEIQRTLKRLVREEV